MTREPHILTIEAPDSFAIIDFLDVNASVRVTLDKGQIRIEVTASPSETSYNTKFESYTFELPEQEEESGEEDEDNSEEDEAE